MNTYYFYEFSDLTREPLKFTQQEFEKFCVDNKIYMYLSCYAFGFTRGFSVVSNEIICTCIPGTNVVISRMFNDRCTLPMAKQLENTLDAFLKGYSSMDDTIDFIKEIKNTTSCHTYLLDIAGDTIRFLVTVNGKNYKLIAENNYEDYDKGTWEFNGSKFLFKINQINLMRETETNFIRLFNEINFNI